MLKEPVDQHQNTQSKPEDLVRMSLDELPDDTTSNSNFDDFLGFYYAADCKLPRTSSLEEIQKCWRDKKKSYMKGILLAYPDRSNGIDMGFQQENES